MIDVPGADIHLQNFSSPSSDALSIRYLLSKGNIDSLFHKNFSVNRLSFTPVTEEYFAARFFRFCFGKECITKINAAKERIPKHRIFINFFKY